MSDKCHCGLDLHYSNSALQKQVQEIVDKFGPYIDVIVGGRTFRVQRHYIALHGIKGKDLSTLGFAEVSNSVA